MPALDRELFAVAVLAALGWERQVLSHLLGARRLGAGPAAVRRAFNVGLSRADARGRVAARKAWRIALAAARGSRPRRRRRAG